MPESSTARVEHGRITVESSPALWESDPDDPLGDWEEVADELVADVTDALRYSLAESGPRPTIELTGGKDSRLLLAVALRAGLADEFRFTTYGPANLPDRQVAGSLAARFDLDHHSPTRSTGAQRSLSDRYRAHVHATSGTSNCFDHALPDEQSGLVLAGFFGECFRTATARAAKQPPPTWDDAAQRFRLHRKFGDAGLLDADVEDVLRESGVSYFLEPSDRVRGPAELRPTFYFRCHVPRWQGPMVDAHRRRLYPFYSPTAIRAAFGMGSTARNRELVHRHVITQASAELAAVPFANDTWRDEAVPRQQPVRGAVDASRAPRPKFERERTQLALELIDASPQNPLFDVVDPTALRDAAARMHDLRQPEVQQVLGAVTSLIWLGETEMPSRPQPEHLSQDVDLRSPEEPVHADGGGAVEH